MVFQWSSRLKLKKGLEERGDYIALQNDGISIYLWQDAKPVVVVSTNSHPDSITKVKRKMKDGSTKEVNFQLLYKCTTSIWVASI